MVSRSSYKHFMPALIVPPDIETFVTVDEAAEIFRIRPRLLYQACKIKKLRHHRLGKHIRIRYGDLLAFTQSGVQPLSRKLRKIAP